MKVLRLRLLHDCGTGELIGDDLECLPDGKVSSLERMLKDGLGWTHCTDVPCQVRVASVQETSECGCRMSMLSTDAIVSVFK